MKGEKTMTMTIWEVQKYGRVLYDYENTYDGKYRYENKVYYSKGKYFAETWCNGVLLFTTLIR